MLLFLLSALQANAAPAPAGSSLRVVASATYTPAGYVQTETVQSNLAALVVLPVEAASLTHDQTLTLPAAAPVTLSHQLLNSGNMPSSYSLTWANGGPDCNATDGLALAGLKLVRDANANGVVDPTDPEVPLGAAGAIELKPGESVMLLAVGAMPNAAAGTVCATLTATSADHAVTVRNRNQIDIGNVAVLMLYNAARYAEPLLAGTSRIDYLVRGVNTGSERAQSLSAAPDGTALLIDGQAANAILIRSFVPVGTRYVPGSLDSPLPQARRLFRLPSDPPFSYRTRADDASAVEVAIALPAASIGPGVGYEMQFAVVVTDGFQRGQIDSVAQAYFHDGLRPTVSASNLVPILLRPPRIGVAERASLPQANSNQTADVTLAVRVKNYGATWLHDVQLTNVLEGGSPSQFGTYTSAAAPGVGQYTVLPGSVKIVQASGGPSGQMAGPNASFNGTAAGSGLLAPGAILPLGGDLTVMFVVRFNTTGRDVAVLNSTTATAAFVPGGPPVATDESVDGSDPDPTGTGNPGLSASPTQIAGLQPLLSLTKQVSLPRHVAPGVFDVDFLFKLTNHGGAAAPNVRILDNLNCAFSMDKPEGGIKQWELQGPVRTGGLLQPSGNFTGRAPCNRAAWDSADSRQFPTEVALSLVDGSQPLGAGQSEQVGFTVRVTLKDAGASARTAFVNKGWAVSLSENTINIDSALLAASSTSMDSQVASASVALAPGMLVDPQGTVYDAVSRKPLAGALVNVRRTSCDGSSAGAITADQLFDGDSGMYTYNADGSITMKTGATGTWQFYFLSPPVQGKCTYAVSVTPPVGSGYLFPARRIPPESGSFSRCGAVVPHGTPPLEGEPTAYYTSLVAGTNPDGSPCEALNNHIPLDPGLENGLILRKSASKQQVEYGDFIDYALTLTNKTGFKITTGLRFQDTLPPGFAYVPGSARFMGAELPAPTGGVGPALSWNVTGLALEPEAVVMLRYRVRVGVGARVSGSATNRAQVLAKGYHSNQAEHTVRVNGGVFSDEAFAFGKVYMDCRRQPDLEGEDEPGVPGVRLWLEDGSNVVTDAHGRWSLYGLSPKTHVLRLDETTLPAGARVAVQDNRNAGTASSRFVDVKKGEFHKANFPLEGCEDAATRAAVQARHAEAAKNLGNEFTTALRSRLDPKAQVVVQGDSRGMSASGQLNGGGGSTAPAGSGALIDLSGPRPRGAGDSFLANGGSTGTLGLAQQSRVVNSAPVASGQVPGAGVGSQLPGQPGSVTQGLVPMPVAPSSVELEKLMPDLDKAPGFIELRDGDTLPSQVLNVRVKGPAGTQLRLSVNGTVLDGRRVGKKATLPRTGTTAWEYIGVQTQPGRNQLSLQVVDDMGIERGAPVEIAVIAPDKLGQIVLTLPGDARADLRTPVPVTVRLTDVQGVPVTARTLITLESDSGRWTDDDLNPQEPGLQTFIQGGQGVFHLLPPGTPGTLRIRASTNGIVQEAPLVLLPDLRPMIAVGIVEGTLDLSRRGTLSVGQLPAGAAFEQELRSLGGEGDDARAAGRAAFFLKGAIKGEYLLTAALDTDKARKDRLFRDIRPDEFYPLYGDASERAYDAQSSQRLYVRIDKNCSYLLYGDFTTASSAEVRKLSQTSRTLTGVKGVYDEVGARVTTYAARTSQQQQVEELRGLGLSGPYYLKGNFGSLVENTETVELIARDRNQPGVILKRTPLTRLVDYTFEPSLGRLMLLTPLASVDTDLNPQFLRVTYETEAGGPKYTVAGVDAQFRVGDRLQAGVVAHVDDDPKNPRKLAAATALARVGDNTSLAAEAVRTHSDDKGTGTAGRIEVRHEAGDLGISAQASTANAGFDNPAAGTAPGSTQASARAEYRVDPTLAVRAEALYSKNGGQGEAARGQSASVLKRFGKDLSVEVGVRHGSTEGSGSALFTEGQVATSGSSGAAAGGAPVAGTGAASLGAASGAQNDLLTVRTRVTATVPGTPQAQVFVEAEQDTRESSRHSAAVGGSYALTDKTRLYGRYEFASSLYDIGALQSRSVGLFGVESNYIEGGRVFNEYRVADATASRTAQLASGVRQTIKLGEHWQLTGGMERSRALGSVAGDGQQAGLGSATALTSGVEYSRGDWRATAVLEGRRGSDADTLLNTLGLGYRLNDEWTLLARTIYNTSRGVGSLAGNERTQSRQQLGAAYRPVGNDRWNALARYEHRSERIVGAAATEGAVSATAFGTDGSLPGTSEAHIVSLHANYSLSASSTLSGRFAFKTAMQEDGLLKSRYTAQLLYGRWTRDLTDKWDLGLQGGLLRGSGGALQKSLGAELGYLITRDLWFSAGYNLIGLSDRDLTAGEYTSRGFYLRLRFKFDETGLGLQGTAPASKDSGAAALGAARRAGVDVSAASGLIEIAPLPAAAAPEAPQTPVARQPETPAQIEGTDP